MYRAKKKLNVEFCEKSHPWAENVIFGMMRIRVYSALQSKRMGTDFDEIQYIDIFQAISRIFCFSSFSENNKSVREGTIRSTK